MCICATAIETGATEAARVAVPKMTRRTKALIGPVKQFRRYLPGKVVATRFG